MGEAGGEVKEAGLHAAEEEPAPVLGRCRLMWPVLLQQAVLGWQMEPCDPGVEKQEEGA